MKFANPTKTDKEVATTVGHAFTFPGMKNGEPQFIYVPPVARKQVREAGMIPEDENGYEEEKKVVKTARPEDDDEFKKDVFTAFAMMVEEGDTKKFTAGGLPQDKALAKILGYEIDAAERKDLWAEFQKANAGK
jgi:hypothetical protein